MDISHVQSSIEAVNQLLEMAVSRTTQAIEKQIAVEVALKTGAVGSESTASAPDPSGQLGNSIDLIV